MRRDQVINFVVLPPCFLAAGATIGLVGEVRDNMAHETRANIIDHCLDAQPDMTRIDEATQACLVFEGMKRETVMRDFKIGETVVKIQAVADTERANANNFSVRNIVVGAGIGVGCLALIAVYPSLHASTPRELELLEQTRREAH